MSAGILRVLKPPVVGSSDAACCVFVHLLLERAYGLKPATGALLAAWRLFPSGSLPDGRKYVTGEQQWGPVLAAADTAVAVTHWHPPTVQELQPGSCALVQGWRSNPTDGIEPDSGHTFLWFACAEGNGLLLDSTQSRGMRCRESKWKDATAQFKHGMAVAVLHPLR